MLRRTFYAVSILFNATLLICALLWMHAPIVGACEIWTPLASRVEKAKLIVAGHIESIERDKYSVELPESRATPWGEKAGVKRTRWLDDATLVVTDVIKGSPEFMTTEITDDGDTVRTVHALFDGPIKRSDGMSESISTDHHGRVGDEGAWFLVGGEIAKTYRAGLGASVAEVPMIRACMHTLETNYADWTPGLTPDSLTTLVTCGSNYNTHAQSIAFDDGSVVLMGTYRGDFFIAGQRQFACDDWDTFIARIDPRGRLAWSRALGSGRDLSLTLARGLGNTFLLTGEVYGATSVLETPLPWANAPQHVVLCLSDDGHVLWQQTFDGRGPIDPRGSRIGAEGFWITPARDHYRVAGSFFGEMSCDGRRIQAPWDSDWFVGTLAKDGTLRTLRAICPAGDQRASVAMSSGDRVVMAGATGMHWREDQPMEQQSDIFVSVLSDDGRTVWADTVGGRWPDNLQTAAIGPDGMIVVSMSITGDATSQFVNSDEVQNTRVVPGAQTAYLCAWSASGKRLWNVEGGANLISFGPDGNIYCAGTYGEPWSGDKGPAYLPPSAGDRDIYVACYDTNGTRLWARRDGGMSAEYASALHLLPDHRAILVGNFDGTSYLAGHVAKVQGWSSAFVLNVALPRAGD